ncbi:hypothetical protein ABK040_012752 [Willaertia magna]
MNKNQIDRLLSISCGLAVTFACLSLIGVLLSSFFFSRLRQPVYFPNPEYFPSNDTIRFLVIGDFGRANNEQKLLANAMGEYCSKTRCDFIVGTGDNIYENGVSGVNDTGFKEKFEDIYNHPAIKDLIWYQTIGNHDYRQNPQAEIDYSKVSKRWRMFDYFYNISIPSSNNGFHLNLIVTDTVPYHSLFYYDPWMNRTAFSERKKFNDIQMKWLEETIKHYYYSNVNNNNSWTIVTGHFPVYSTGMHYNSPVLMRLFEPLFIKYKIPLYLSGHDHTNSWLENIYLRDEKKTQYIVSGSGAGVDKYKRPLFNSHLKNVYHGPGFFAVEVQKQFIYVYCLNEKAEVVFYFRIG